MKTFLITLLWAAVGCMTPNLAAAGALQSPEFVSIPEAPEPEFIGIQAIPELPLVAMPAIQLVEPVETPAPQEPLQAPEIDDGPAAPPENAGAVPETAAPVANRNDVVRIGGDYTLPSDETARGVVIIGGSATLEGEVLRDVVIVVGRVELGSSAVVGGDLVVVGGGATIAPGAVVDGDMVVLGEEVILPPGFEPGGEQVLAETFGFGTGFLEFVPFVTRGLFWGRLIVPELAWIWIAVAMFLAVYLGINLVFDSATRACSETISERPLSTLLAGLLALLLAGPLVFLLTVSVVGLVVVPFLFCAFVVAGVIGKVGALRWMGGGILRQDATDSRALAALSVLVGFGLVTLAYMVPVMGLLTWATLGSLGLGAASIAFVRALRSENPAPPAPPASPPPSFAETRAGSDAPGAAAAVSGAEGTGGAAEAGSGAGSTAFAEPAADAAGPTRLDPALFPRAGFLIRLGAFALDFFLAVMTFSLLGLEDVGRFLLLFLIYAIGFWSWKGATVGGIICQFRVVRMDGQKLGFSDALVRGLSSIFSFAALGLGCLWVLWDAERQAWHDKIAGTYVVQVPRNWPLN